MIKLAEELDEQRIDYIWYVFTNDTDAISSDNVIYMKPRLDISYWMDQADYLVQLSDTEGLSYSINEMLYRNKPVIVTPLFKASLKYSSKPPEPGIPTKC